jgi:hypothetical protein
LNFISAEKNRDGKSVTAFYAVTNSPAGTHKYRQVLNTSNGRFAPGEDKFLNAKSPL